MIILDITCCSICLFSVGPEAHFSHDTYFTYLSVQILLAIVKEGVFQRDFLNQMSVTCKVTSLFLPPWSPLLRVQIIITSSSVMDHSALAVFLAFLQEPVGKTFQTQVYKEGGLP